jgi:sec-independent protein translocase protein TatA
LREISSGGIAGGGSFIAEITIRCANADRAIVNIIRSLFTEGAIVIILCIALFFAEENNMLGLSPLELAVIAVLVVLLFGTKRLPELGSGLGKAINNFRQSFKDGSAIDVSNKNNEADKKA